MCVGDGTGWTDVEEGTPVVVTSGAPEVSSGTRGDPTHLPDSSGSKLA